MKYKLVVLSLVIIALLFCGCVSNANEEKIVTPPKTTPSPTPIVNGSPTIPPIINASPTVTPSSTPMPTATANPTAYPSPATATANPFHYTLPTPTPNPTPLASGSYYAIVGTGTYHNSSCLAIQSVPSDYLITFQTKAQAEAAGYKPCPICIH